MNLPYQLIKQLKEMAVSAISTAEDVNDTVHVIVDYRVDKCDVTDTLLPHGAAEVSFQSAQRIS